MAVRRMERADLAAASGICPRTLTNVLGANSQALARSKITAICEVLGLEYDDIVLGKRPEPRRPADNRPPKDKPKPPDSPQPAPRKEGAAA